MEPTVQHSVIIPCYNASGTLGEQLEALARQEWEGSWEVIVADNGSNDHPERVLERYRDRLPRLRLVDASRKRGAGFARNEGAKAARGEQLSFVDADDVVAEGWLAAMVAALGEHAFVASRHEFQRLNSPEVLGSRRNQQERGLQSYTYPPFLPHSGGCGLGIQRWLHEAVGGFDERFVILEDTDYCWRVQLLGHDLAFAPEAAVHIRFRNRANRVYRQARQYGFANVHLYSRYRPLGMPSVSWKDGVAGWLRVASHLPQVLSPERRMQWMWQFGWRYGRLLGSLRYRKLSL